MNFSFTSYKKVYQSQELLTVLNGLIVRLKIPAIEIKFAKNHHLESLKMACGVCMGETFDFRELVKDLVSELILTKDINENITDSEIDLLRDVIIYHLTMSAFYLAKGDDFPTNCLQYIYRIAKKETNWRQLFNLVFFSNKGECDNIIGNHRNASTVLYRSLIIAMHTTVYFNK